MKEIKNRKRFLVSIAAALAIVAGSLFAAGCSGGGTTTNTPTETAASMRLIRAEGDVKLEDSSGTVKNAIVNVRFQSGQAVSTGIESLASISLDDDKIVSLEESSRAEFIKNGKYIQLTLTKGGLFFDVKKKLDEDETFDIKTATMMAGIRGTSGYFGQNENGDDVFYLTDGTVQATFINPVTNETQELEITPGQKVTVSLNNNNPGNSIVLNVETFTPEELPNFSKKMISESDNVNLIKRIGDANGWTTEEIINVVEHTHRFVNVAPVAATCETAGNTSYWYCDECGKYFEDHSASHEITLASTVIPALGHHLTHTAAVAATCETAGNSEYWHCDTCGKYFGDAGAKQEITLASTSIPAKGHDLEMISAVTPTCDRAGNIEYWHCYECGKNFSNAAGTNEIALADTVLPALDHSLVHVSATEPTCTEQGNIEYWYCTECFRLFSDDQGINEITEASVILTGGHSLTHVAAVEGNCQHAGNIEYWHCSECGKYFSDAAGTAEITQAQTVVAGGTHDLVYHKAKESTCSEHGNAEYWHCQACGKNFSDETCTEEVSDKYIELPLSDIHSFLLYFEVLDPTCTEYGNRECVLCYDCKRTFEPGDYYEGEAVEINGKTAYYAVSDEEFPELGEEIDSDDALIPPLAHQDASHVEASDPDCDDDGNIEYWYCETCGKYFSDKDMSHVITREQTVVPARHNLTHYEAVAATCDAAGNIEYWHCSGECGKYFSNAAGTAEITREQTIVPRHNNHLTYTAGVTATCDDAGNIEYWHCSECGKYYSNAAGTAEITQEQTVVPRHNNHLANVAAVDATCDSPGNIEYWHCDICGKYFSNAAGTAVITQEQTVIAASHTSLSHIIAKDATYDEAGNIEHWYCSDCGKYYRDAACTAEITQEQTVIPRLDGNHTHSFTSYGATGNEEGKAGHREFYWCEGCGKIAEDSEGTRELTKSDIYRVGDTYLTYHVAETTHIEYWTDGENYYTGNFGDDHLIQTDPKTIFGKTMSGN